ncbi:type I-E CRISPR-associated protein Cse2/CasB [Sphaerotilus mobilis]|uniref:CRISPR-associated Cse2 family protein n=1 Tax=Sphaerotilus mobilis TaxID=47994 RepID=A0A4V2EVM3_9BURK|nr:type I-E CRISPR-associated protein Cse2/CasB [Sphaerotilus mobilis]RZS52990.1 CRISPR-associated Cse2 family protein [Sphaerotilus mobilis]
MSDLAERFVAHLGHLAERDRGALAVLRRSLTFAPGTHPASYPHVERFVPDGHERDALRQALYLVAGLYASHPRHQAGTTLARSFGLLMQHRDSPSIEKRFIALLSSDADGLPELLRQVVSLLSADGRSLDYVALLNDLIFWLRPWALESRDRLRQRWARDFYRTTPDEAPDAVDRSDAA